MDETTLSTPLRGAAPTRRRVLALAAGAGAAGVLTACGGGSGGTSGGSGGSGGGSTGGSGGSSGSGGSGGTLVATSQVPVGGGVILEQRQVVVTQPTAGTFKCFSAVCTHMGCLVGDVQDGSIICPCHGSTFSATDGSVQGGPAPSPLSPVAISVANGEVVQS